MKKDHLEELKKKYPAKVYNVTEKSGRVVIAKKKTTVWIRERLLKDLPLRDSEALSSTLNEMLEKAAIEKSHFRQVQVAVTKEFARHLAKKAKALGVHQMTYLSECVRVANEKD